MSYGLPKTIALVALLFIISQVDNRLSSLLSGYQPHHSKANTENPDYSGAAATSSIPNQTFQIKHIYHHGAGEHYKVHRRLDITPDFISRHQLEAKRFSGSDLQQSSVPDSFQDVSPWTAKIPLNVDPAFPFRRLEDRSPDTIESYLKYIHSDIANINKVELEWIDEVSPVPNVTDKNTVLNLAIMASNAYVGLPGTGDWKDVGIPWHNESSYGWMSDGLRGHVFVNEDESIVVISIKGTSAAYVSKLDVDGAQIIESLEYNNDEVTTLDGSDTVNNDKINDNLLFSCCCARVSYLWTTVCDCYKSSYTCDQKCLEKELRRDDRYYQAVLDLYRNVTSHYPKANVWVTGHSLGGALSALLARTYGLPAVTFQAPGDLLATKRLHLPVPPGLPSDWEHVWHFGNTGDPIFMGVCNGASSTCSLGGYAMESQCHSGKTCIYDTVTDLGWSVSIYNHRIHAVIDDVIMKYNETAECRMPSPCQDCFNWKYVVDDSDDKYKTSTTKVPSSSKYKSCTTCSATSSSSVEHKCKKFNWLGKCVEWEDDLN
ncbi:triglyceride lipase [Saccharomycopsis crataegensis]|uniref:Putative lipase ATG15 n=1 Tax=Saccharomycopsis crataegensis TaxID=43959 RepID=A0AAV5QEW5_9ASCO|nr:triglyceride lipase [Saccharomycopsis crataegensis]